MNGHDPVHGHLDPFSYSFSAMGTACRLLLFADTPEQGAMAAAMAAAEVERIEGKFSRYAPSSDLSVLNRQAANADAVSVDEETAALLDYAFACHAKSGSLFDITAGVLRRAWDFSSGTAPSTGVVTALLPLIGMDKLYWQPPVLRFAQPGMELDLGGIGKEYAADRVATLLTDAGIAHGLIDFGGDLVALGPAPGGQPWRIGLRDPSRAGTAMGEITLSGGALATSGDYARCIESGSDRYGHILDPRTGWPVRGLTSVTVLAPRCMVAGSAATIAMLKGREGIAWLDRLGLPHFWVDDNGRRGGTALINSSAT